MTEPRTYRKRPVENQAMQWDGTWDSYLQLGAWVRGDIMWYPAQDTVVSTNEVTGKTISVPLDTPLPVRVKLHVAANDEWLTLEPGEWVIRDSRGFYPCKPDIFEQTYEPVD